MGEVCALREVPAEGDPKIVALLEQLLKEAKAGEVTAFAYVIETRVAFDVGYQGPLYGILALLERLKHRINVALDERPET